MDGDPIPVPPGLLTYKGVSVWTRYCPPITTKGVTMLLDKRSLLMAKSASKDETRMALAGVRIEADGSGVATDGHILFKFTPDAVAVMDPKDYPHLEGVDPVIWGGVNTLKPFTIPTKDALDIAKAIPKRSCLPVLEFIALDEQKTNDNGSACFGVTDLESPRVFSPRKIDMDFPDYEKCYPKAGNHPTAVVGLGIDVLEKAVQTLKAAGVESIRLEIRDPLSAVVVTSDLINNGGKVTGLIMPRKLGG